MSFPDFSGSLGLNIFFSTLSNLVVANGSVPTLFAAFGPSMVSVDASSLEAYHEKPQAMHSNWEQAKRYIIYLRSKLMLITKKTIKSSPGQVQFVYKNSSIRSQEANCNKKLIKISDHAE